MDRNIQRLVRREASAVKPTITADELFTSREYASHIQSLVDTTTGRFSVPLKVVLHHGGSDTACTDGNQILANTRSHFIYRYRDLESKYLAAVGMIFHECAHVLFLDFDASRKATSMLENGLFYGDEPSPETKEQQDALEDMKMAMAQKEYAPLFTRVYHEILNCVADPHDEDALIAEYGGFVQRAILVLRESLFASASSVELMEEKVQKGELSKLSMAYGVILCYARFGRVISDHPEKVMETETLKKLMELGKDINFAQYTDDPVVRAGHINSAMLALWPWIREELDQIQKKEGQGGQQNNQGDPPSEQAIQSVLEQLNQGANESGMTQAPVNRMSSGEAKARSKQAKNEKNARAPGVTSSQQEGQSVVGTEALDRLLSEVAGNIAAEIVQDQVMVQTCQEIKATDQNSTHLGVPVRVLPQTDVTEEDIRAYNEAMKDIAGCSKRLQRRMKEALRDLRDGDVAHHKVSGNRFDARSAYRVDEKYFSRKKAPQDLPDMAISLLCDLSGSMCGARIDAARKAAMLLYDFATGLDIPISVSGHSAGEDFRYYTYTDFHRVRPSEKYRLAKMVAGGRNRDGMAVQIAGNLLAKRPEEVKLLFILSDGLPNHTNYGGDAAAKDIQSIVKRLKKQGVTVIAAAIGDDKEQIKEIYGDGSYLCVDDLTKLPMALARIVRKKITPN